MAYPVIRQRAGWEMGWSTHLFPGSELGQRTIVLCSVAATGALLDGAGDVPLSVGGRELPRRRLVRDGNPISVPDKPVESEGYFPSPTAGHVSAPNRLRHRPRRHPHLGGHLGVLHTPGGEPGANPPDLVRRQVDADVATPQRWRPRRRQPPTRWWCPLMTGETVVAEPGATPPTHRPRRPPIRLTVGPDRATRADMGDERRPPRCPLPGRVRHEQCRADAAAQPAGHPADGGKLTHAVPFQNSKTTPITETAPTSGLGIC